MTAPPDAGPLVAIGGLGGSGTRVFAAAVQVGGVALGERLNAALDNLWFTVLFKRAAWSREPPQDRDVAEAADLFHRAMTVGLRDTLLPDERALLVQLRADLPPLGTWRCGATVEDADSLIDSGPALHGPGRVWGWKEPNTHVFLPRLATRFPQMRYIHIVRDGLDMAFSTNTWQARHWSHLHGLPQGRGTPPPLQQLRYWTAANRAALDYGTAHMADRFLVASYEEYCRRPGPFAQRLRRFLGLAPGTALLQDLPLPTSIGRSRVQDLSLFPPDLLAAARALKDEVAALNDFE